MIPAAVPVASKSEVPCLEKDVRVAGGYCVWGLAMADGHGHGKPRCHSAAALLSNGSAPCLIAMYTWLLPIGRL
jgi:hypothetical protein